jgi:hypothetical protein
MKGMGNKKKPLILFRGVRNEQKQLLTLRRQDNKYFKHVHTAKFCRMWYSGWIRHIRRFSRS